MRRFRWMALVAITGLLVGSGLASAQDRGVPGEDHAAATAARAEQARLAAIQANRDRTISELMGMWAPHEGASQLEVALQAASARQLLQVSEAGSFAEVEKVLLGETAGAPSAVPNTLGDTTQDYVFTPVTPCRIFDTRNAGGAFAANTTREFYVYGPAGDITPQGGNAAGCPAPAGKGEPRAVHIQVSVVPVGSPGNVRVYPANVTTPNTSVISFISGLNFSNALTVGTYVAFGPKEIEVYVGNASAHVIADVMGYYYDAATPSFMASSSADTTVPDFTETTVIFDVEDHDTGADYNNTTGIFTVPETGLYNVSCHLQYGSIPTGTTRVNIYLKRNAGNLAVTFGNNLANDDFLPRMLTGTWQLTAGDAISCNAFLNTPGGSGSVSSLYSFFSATRVR